jgi:cytochrome c-type biogenesis protein
MSYLLLVLTALWLGILTSISPCPLATNVAAISVLSRRIGERKRALAYTAGRVSIYLILSFVFVAGLSSMPVMSAFLRTKIVPFVGPLLILVGMALLGWLPLPGGFKVGGEQTVQRVAGWGLLGEFCLGGVFALSFCPVSAALFFGSLIPMALASNILPVIIVGYGIGTALPVGIIAVLLVLSTLKASQALKKLQIIQKSLLTITAIVIIGVGVWLTFRDALAGLNV